MKKVYLIKSLLIIFSFLFFHSICFGQLVPEEEQRTITISLPDILPSFEEAPRSESLTESDFLVQLPFDGSGEKTFRVIENDLLSASVQKAFPDIRAYAVQMVEDPSIIGDITISPNGFFAHYLVDGSLIGIYPKDLNNPVEHLVEIGTQEEYYELGANYLSCGVTTAAQMPLRENRNHSRSSGGTFSYTDSSTGEVLKRKYDLAIAATGEFTQANGGTTASAMAVITSSMNCINSIFCKELAVSMVLVKTCISTNPNTDPFTPDNSSSASGLGTGPSRGIQAADQIAICAGATTYDIGHVFHTHDAVNSTLATDDGWSLGGVAGLGVVCKDTPCNFSSGATTGPCKGAGWSGSFSNTNNGWCQLAAHEFGHMFGAPHTFNGTGNSCTNNISGGDGYEIASGNTIMSYNGICGSTYNIPDGGLSDNYFHKESIRSMTSYLGDLELNELSCQQDCATGNFPPTADADPCGAGNGIDIPIGTPFKLTATATDPNGDALTYNWEQIDEDGAGTPSQGATLTQTGNTTGLTAGNDPNAPLFRSYPPSSNPTRCFPDLAAYKNSVNTVGTEFEVLPQVARSMTFGLTVRDCNPNGGGVCCDMRTINVIAGGPLVVDSPCSGGDLTAGNVANITWNTNGSDAACTNVDIQMSIDGGCTFPYTLGSAAYASGTAPVTIPAGTPCSTTARFQVTCKDNPCATFYAMTASDCTINSACKASASIICPVEDVSAVACSANANLSLAHTYTTLFTSTLITEATSRQLVTNNMSNNGCFAGNNSNSGTLSIIVDAAGSYTINIDRDFNGGFGFASIFTGNSPLDCTTFLASSGSDLDDTPGGSISAGTSITATLSACTEYTIVGWNFGSGVTDISITGISGSGTVYTASSNAGANYQYTFVAVNQATGMIGAVDAGGDFINLPVGCYDIYGVDYENDGANATAPTDVNPTTFIGQSINSVLSSGACATFSENSKQLCITPANVISNIVLNGTPSCSGSNAQYTICFDATLGSGDYDLINADNNLVLSSLTGQATTGTDICFSTVTVSNHTAATTLNINVVDNTDPTCKSGTAISINLPACLPCPIVDLEDDSDAICSGDLNTEISSWQTDVEMNTLNMMAILNTNTASSASYSTVLLTGAVTAPNGLTASGTHGGADKCVAETQDTYAYLLCYGADGIMGSADDSYLLLGTHTLTVNPDVQAPTETIIGLKCSGDMYTGVSTPTGGAATANWDASTGVYTAPTGALAGTLKIKIKSGVTGSTC